MRIFSNIPLTWPQVLHVFHAARLHPGCLATQLLFLPIRLQMNSHYYSYDKYLRDKSLEVGSEMISMLWIPKAAQENDIIAIKSASTGH